MHYRVLSRRRPPEAVKLAASEPCCLLRDQQFLHGVSPSSSLHSPNGRCLWKIQHSACIHSSSEGTAHCTACCSIYLGQALAVVEQGHEACQSSYWRSTEIVRRLERFSGSSSLFEDFLFMPSLSTTSPAHLTACIEHMP